MGDNESRRREITARIGAATREAQYALMVTSPQRVTNAMSGTHAALVALSEYLALPNGLPKAAAVAKRIAKMLRHIMVLQRQGSTAEEGTTQSETDINDAHMSHDHFMRHFLDEAPEDDHELQQLREKLTGLQEERDSVVTLLHSAQQELATLKQSTDGQTHESSPSSAEIEHMHNENRTLKEILQEEILKTRTLEETLRDSNEKLQQMHHTNATLKVSLEQHRSALQENEKKMASAERTASRAAVMNPEPLDSNELEALKLQVKLLHQTLRECSNNTDAAEIKAGKKTLVDIQYEHHEQLLAMKVTLEEQYKIEKNLNQQINDLKNFIVDTEKELERERRRAEEAEHGARECV
ncbi:hypothetical protein TraAM80_09202 [Trypanosoma rangeli]|uniref:Uncharacterized protein n=1 Tax=Trypanosoma rangeli TaxID=5698 RepID=A0A3R7KMT0_TRYRA|nr:uncharacterized protein TraAM80_09202 [Trypanosoma rangeli]RNE97659.1 hypothetical protein TraAM80_09202 [Trypanosoma rangeli]|eukprot:RNE97659.1 hypothetical protein TraAM80_09202 [Trypanosoma rangeli]